MTTQTTQPQTRPGMVSHTEFASEDPEATRDWCRKVLGWQFESPLRLPEGEYHMWRHASGTGGGIRGPGPGEPVGVTPYVEVEDIHATVAKATLGGAETLLPPTRIEQAGGWIAIVRAPGGVPVGFWALK